MDTECLPPPKVVLLFQVWIIDKFDMEFTHLFAGLPIIEILHGWYFLTSSIYD